MDKKPALEAGDGKNAGGDKRSRRLAEQLRANLQKRKAQARSRRNGDADQRTGMAGGDGAAIAGTNSADEAAEG